MTDLTLTELSNRSSALLPIQHGLRDAGDHDAADRIQDEQDAISAEILERLTALVNARP